jgi:hypothetical protein
MPRLSQKQYQQRTMLVMGVYVGFMLLAWPAVRHMHSTPLKVLLALAPVLPMLYMIALMARRIRDSDELEQRTHLLALGVATAVVGGLSLVGGFLAAARVLQLDGTILIWVFPVMMLSYGATRWWIGRRYGISMACDEAGGVPMYLRLWLLALLFGLLALIARHSLEDSSLGMLCGMSASFGLLGTWQAVARAMARRQEPREHAR